MLVCYSEGKKLEEKDTAYWKIHKYDIWTIDWKIHLIYMNEMENTCKWYFDSQWQKIKACVWKTHLIPDTNNDIENICMWYWFFIFILTYNDRN